MQAKRAVRGPQHSSRAVRSSRSWARARPKLGRSSRTRPSRLRGSPRGRPRPSRGLSLQPLRPAAGWGDAAAAPCSARPGRRDQVFQIAGDRPSGRRRSRHPRGCRNADRPGRDREPRRRCWAAGRLAPARTVAPGRPAPSGRPATSHRAASSRRAPRSSPGARRLPNTGPAPRSSARPRRDRLRDDLWGSSRFPGASHSRDRSPRSWRARRRSTRRPSRPREL